MGNTGTGYITRAEAAEILGIGVGAVRGLVERGVLTSTGVRAKPSLDRAQVERVAARLAREQAEREARAAARGPIQPPQPPDADHDWLTVPQAAELLGRSRQGIEYRCKRDSIPHEVHDSRRWLRRDLLEPWARAQTAQSEA